MNIDKLVTRLFVTGITLGVVSIVCNATALVLSLTGKGGCQ